MSNKKYAAVLDFTPCVRTAQKIAKKQGAKLNNKQAICVLAEIIKQKMKNK